jgi:hypothetical protein
VPGEYIEAIEFAFGLAVAAERKACAEHYLGIMREAIKEEREACAILLENYAVQYDAPVWAIKIAEAIRARGRTCQ